MMTDIKISVLVATRNRSESLSRLLERLYAQVDALPFEIIIGDNGSSDETPKVVDGFRDRLRIHYVREECSGKGYALNAALKHAQGNLVVFTDDDVRPYPDWLAQLYAASIRYTDANIFGGLIEINHEEIPGWIKRSYNLMGLLTSAHKHGETDVIYSYGQYPFGPNMAIRRHLLNGIDAPYPEHLGPGTKYPVGDESAFFLQFSSPGAQDRIFVSAAKVFHNVEQQNMTLRNVLQRSFIAGFGHVQIRWPESAECHSFHTSTLGLILARLSSCRSFRELACISVRYIGHLMGSVKFSTKS